MCKIATKSHRNMKAARYLNSGTDSICCSLLAVIMEQMFLLLCWVFFVWVVAFLFYRLVFSTCILDKLVISSLKKKKKGNFYFRQVYFYAFSAHLFHLSSPHLTSDVFCYLGFLPNILTGSYKKRKPLKCRTKEVIQAAN